MSHKAIGEGLKQTITISGLKIYALHKLPDKISPPAAVMALGETIYHRSYSGGTSPYTADFMIRFIVLLGKVDTPSAANRLLDYVEPGGRSAIAEEVEKDPTLNGSCQAAIVTRNLGLGVTNWGGVDYLSTEFEIEIWT